MIKLLIVDDDKNILNSLNHLLKSEYEVFSAKSLKEAREIIRDSYIEIMILDINLPDGSGVDFIDEIKKLYDSSVIIMSTANRDIRLAVNAMKKGAFDYLSKPYDLEELKIVLKKAVENKRLKERVETLESELGFVTATKEIIGNSEAIKKVFSKIELIYDRDIPVLIRGGSGSGKELIARMIHSRSNRRRHPFIAVNCAAIPETLIENELFGHNKGSYTGANETQRGKFEIAGEGVIFLDEIGCLSPASQSKLLRVLQDSSFNRIGDNKILTTKARMIFATSLNLEKEIEHKNFREDLYYRINAFPVQLPDLKDRKEDIPMLVEHFIKRANQKYNLNINGIDSGLLEKISNYYWPGNVRQLENCIEQMCLFNENNCYLKLSENIGQSQFLFLLSSTTNFEAVNTENYNREKNIISIPDNFDMKQIEKNVIEFHLKKNNFKMGKTAFLLGFSRKTLFNKIQEYGIIKTNSTL